MPRTPATLWTVGYEGRNPGELAGMLRMHGIEQLVDVRENPWSRNPAWIRENLAATLAGADIAYVHLRALGAPPHVRHAGHDRAGYEGAYLRHLGGQPEAVGTLKRLAVERPTVLLCREARVEDCHRRLVAGLMEAEGFRTVHL